MLHLQIFRQFIEERLNMLNTGKGFSDEFEMEAVRFQEKVNNSNSRLRHQYAQISSSVKKEGGAIVKAVKSKANPAMKSAVKSVREGGRGLQHKSKSAYREMRSKMKPSASGSNLEQHHHRGASSPASSSGSSNSPGLRHGRPLPGAAHTSSAPSSPVLKTRAMSVRPSLHFNTGLLFSIKEAFA